MFEDAALKQLKLTTVLENIARMENFEATEEDVEKAYEEIAAENNAKVKDIKKFVALATLKNDIIVEKAFNFVLDNVKYVEVEKKSA